MKNYWGVYCRQQHLSTIMIAYLQFYPHKSWNIIWLWTCLLLLLLFSPLSILLRAWYENERAKCQKCNTPFLFVNLENHCMSYIMRIVCVAKKEDVCHLCTINMLFHVVDLLITHYLLDLQNIHITKLHIVICRVCIWSGNTLSLCIIIICYTFCSTLCILEIDSMMWNNHLSTIINISCLNYPSIVFLFLTPIQLLTIYIQMTHTPYDFCKFKIMKIRG